ncbi:hypothetical protein L3Q82_013107 [Scortum barcoo]|uniref:Uncharacterized protein n=1 Tax=Scortum barcoo TaxID=214431 RepID=A0ACB8VZ55_9TELE|nr:hypothetical protein L3Q82_013107 [Scortum barcoo]
MIDFVVVSSDLRPYVLDTWCGWGTVDLNWGHCWTVEEILRGSPQSHRLFSVHVGLWQGCPLSPGDVVLLASSSQDLQHVLERFAAECEATEMRISTSKSEAMVLNRKRVACPIRVGGEVLPQVEEFKYLGVLFTSEGKMEHEIDWYRTVLVKKELNRKAKLSRFDYRPIYLTYGHELWVMTERTR